jgi:outer membrane lipase/esterase
MLIQALPANCTTDGAQLKEAKGMNIHLPLVRKLPLGSILAGLVLAVGVPAAWAGFTPVGLSSIPGLKPPQFAVAVAIDTFCPRLQTLTLSNRGQADLAARCNELEQQVNFNRFDSSFVNTLGLSNAGLADVLGKLSQAQEGSKGNTAVETAPHQFRVVAGRLASLRRGGPSISLNDFKLNVDGKAISAAQLIRLDEKGGGASADANGSSRFGVFLNGNGSFGSRDPTDREVGFDFHTGGVTAGVDYRFTDNLILGVAFNYLRTDADMNSFLGDVATRGYGGLLYGTYYLGAFYVDASGGFTWNNYDTNRNIVYPTVDRTATGSTSGQEYTANVGTGYDLSLAGFTITPFGRMEYRNLAAEGFTESGALGWDLMIRGQRVQSLRSALGLQVGHSFSVPFGVLVPQVRGEWVHEYKNGSRSITATFVNDPFGTAFFIPTDTPSRNFASLAAGISGVFAKGYSAFVNYETFLGLTHETNHQFTGGVRLEF